MVELFWDYLPVRQTLADGFNALGDPVDGFCWLITFIDLSWLEETEQIDWYWKHLFYSIHCIAFVKSSAFSVFFYYAFLTSSNSISAGHSSCNISFLHILTRHLKKSSVEIRFQEALTISHKAFVYGLLCFIEALSVAPNNFPSLKDPHMLNTKTDKGFVSYL